MTPPGQVGLPKSPPFFPNLLMNAYDGLTAATEFVGVHVTFAEKVGRVGWTEANNTR